MADDISIMIAVCTFYTQVYINLDEKCDFVGSTCLGDSGSRSFLKYFLGGNDKIKTTWTEM